MSPLEGFQVNFLTFGTANVFRVCFVDLMINPTANCLNGLNGQLKCFRQLL